MILLSHHYPHDSIFPTDHTNEHTANAPTPTHTHTEHTRSKHTTPLKLQAPQFMRSSSAVQAHRPSFHWRVKDSRFTRTIFFCKPRSSNWPQAAQKAAGRRGDISGASAPRNEEEPFLLVNRRIRLERTPHCASCETANDCFLEGFWWLL